MRRHCENCWFVDGKTLEEAVAVVVVFVVVAVVASFAVTYFDCFHMPYKLQN